MKYDFRKAFDELTVQFDSIQYHPSEIETANLYESGTWQRWAGRAQNLIGAVFSTQHSHYLNFAEAYKKCTDYWEEVAVLKGIFDGAKDDFKAGFVFPSDLQISGEIFGDFVAMAKQALADGHEKVAAVLACAALEDALKRYASSQEIDVGGKTMQEVIGLLKSGGLVAGAQKSLLDAMPRVRNAALHADWEKISSPEIAGVLGFVEDFLLKKFS
jgi:hypothetical protein